MFETQLSADLKIVDNLSTVMGSFIEREGRMEALVWGAAITGGALLFCSTAILVYFNWSERVFAPIYSIVLVGTATALVTVLLTVKETTAEGVFTTSIVFDQAAGAPPLIVLDPQNPGITSRLSEYSRLGRPMRGQGNQAFTTIPSPVNQAERFTFTAELLQYRIVKLINEMQRGGFAVGMIGGAAFSRVAVPMRLSKTSDYPGHDFIAVLANNRFSNSDIEEFQWEHGHFPLPKNSELDIFRVPTSPKTGPEKYIVRLSKPRYFQIDFVVEPLGATGLGVLPNGVHLDLQLAAQCETDQLKVTMKAVFEKFTAGSSESSEYKEWADWLFAGLQEKLGD
jgi:hypothetical protein